MCDVDYPEVYGTYGNYFYGSYTALAGEKDEDVDGISNFGELVKYGSDPLDPHYFNDVNIDSMYLTTAFQMSTDSSVYLEFNVLNNNWWEFIISGARSGAVYDLYYTQNLANYRWRCIYSGIKCNDEGSATVEIKIPGDNQGYFIIVSADDQDNDGLTDGYEALLLKNGSNMAVIDNDDSDFDSLNDGWEEQYGLDPLDGEDINGSGKYSDPDNDNRINSTEYNNYNIYNPIYDPLKPYNTNSHIDRPVISIYNSSSASDDNYSFTVVRHVSDVSQLSEALTVYYALGGSLKYSTNINDSDYSLNPMPEEWPRICSVTIEPNEIQKTVSVNNIGSLNDGDSIYACIVPYNSADLDNYIEPENWNYTVDWHYNRISIIDTNDKFWINGAIPQELLAEMIVGSDIQISNVDITGNHRAMGIYGNGISAGLDIDEGVIIATGDIYNAYGPNKSSQITTQYYNDNTQIYNGDSDLEELDGGISGTNTYDAAVLEFNIISESSTDIQLNYIFASEEYPEYISGSGGYNDLTAIYVTSEYDGDDWIITTNKNIATINTNTVISVNNINGGGYSRKTRSYHDPTNPEYYRDNCDPEWEPNVEYNTTVPQYDIQYDGITTLLTATNSVSADTMYHIKIAVADYGDGIYDSCIFIQAQ